MLGSMQARPRIERIKLSDQEISVIIEKNWEKALGSGSRMLRLFRDDLHIACEQKRFANIFNEVKKK